MWYVQHNPNEYNVIHCTVILYRRTPFPPPPLKKKKMTTDTAKHTTEYISLSEILTHSVFFLIITKAAHYIEEYITECPNNLRFCVTSNVRPQAGVYCR